MQSYGSKFFCLRFISYNCVTVKKNILKQPWDETATYCTVIDCCQVIFSLCVLWPDIDESKLIDGTEVVNSTFNHNKIGCQMTFDDDYSAYWVYFINFLGTLAVLPGNIVSALLMDKIGRLSMLGKSGGYKSNVHVCVCTWIIIFPHGPSDLEMIHAPAEASIVEYERRFLLGSMI